MNKEKYEWNGIPVAMNKKKFIVPGPDSSALSGKLCFLLFCCVGIQARHLEVVDIEHQPVSKIPSRQH